MDEQRSHNHHKAASMNNHQEIRQMKKITESFDRAKATMNTELCREEAQIRKHLAQLEKEKDESKAELSAYKNFLKDQENMGKEEMRRMQELSNVYEHDLQDMLQHCKYHESNKPISDQHNKKESFNEAKNLLAYNRQQRRMTIRHLQEIIHEGDESPLLSQAHLPQIHTTGSPHTSSTFVPQTTRRGSLARPSIQIPLEEKRIFEHHDTSSQRFAPNAPPGTGRRQFFGNKDNLPREEKEAWLEHHNKFGKHGKQSKGSRFYAVHPNPASYQARVRSILEYNDAMGNVGRSHESTDLHADQRGRRASVNSDSYNRTDGRRFSMNDRMITPDFLGNQTRRSTLPVSLLPHDPRASNADIIAQRRSSINSQSVPLSSSTARKSIGPHTDGGDLQKFMSRFGSRRHTDFASTSSGPSNGVPQRRRCSLFADPVADDIQTKSIQAYQSMLSDAYRHPSAETSEASLSENRHQAEPDKYDKLRDVLRTLPSSRVVTIDPVEALQCRYLRLQPGTVDELEQLCVLMGEDPGVHPHMTEQDVLDYYA